MSDVKRCAACGKENPVSEMEVCMHHQMHRYVCDSKCMTDFYNPPKKPTAAELAARVAELEAELAKLRAGQAPVNRAHIMDALLMWNRRHEAPPIKVGYEYGVAGAVLDLIGTAPQPSAVPDVSAMARILSDRAASACCVDPEDNWKVYGHEFIDDVRAMLSAAPSAPATAQGGWRNHSVNFARAERCPQTIETLQAAWDRDQELIEEQRLEIGNLKQTINQLRQKATVQSVNAQLLEAVPLYAAVERACSELPDGWTIQLHMENGAGWIELYDDCGVHCDDFPTNNERLDYTLNDAIDAAIAAAQEGGK